MQLTTEHQDKVLNIMRSGGIIVEWWENNVSKAHLSTNKGDTLSIRKDTIARLTELEFIKCAYDHPAIDLNTYTITKLGIHWLTANHIESLTGTTPCEGKQHNPECKIK